MGNGHGLFAAKVYFLWNNMSNACVYPFLNIFFQRRGFSKTQIGLMAAVRPWISAASGNIWAAAADHLQAHFIILMVMYVLGVLLRTSMMFAPDFATMLAVVIAKEFFGSPVGIIVDATVLAASKQDSDYGKTRMWGAVGWGGFSPVAGLIVSHYGIDAAFIISLVTGALGTFSAAALPVHALTKQNSPPGDPHCGSLDGPGSGSDEAGPLLPCESCQGSPSDTSVSGETAGSSRTSEAEEDGGLTGRNAGERQVAAPGHILIRLNDSALDFHRDAGGYATVRIAGGKGAKAGGLKNGSIGRGGDQELNSTPGADNAGAAIRGRDSAGIFKQDTASLLPGSSPVDIPATAADEGDIRWPASWPPLDAAARGCSRPDHLPRGSLDRLSSFFLHEVEAHIPVAAIPELLTYDEKSFAWASAALEEGNHPSSRLPSQGKDENQVSAPLLGDRRDVEADPGDPIPPADKSAPSSFLTRLAAVFSTPGALVFFSMAVIMGYAMGTIDFALFLYLDELGASAALMGITVTVTCISEAPAFFCTGWLLQKMGISRVLHMVVGCYLLRLWLYTQLASWGTPWAVLPIELLHGLTFGCGWAAGTVNSARISPPGLQATTQAIFMSLYQGLGLGLGGLLGGIVYHHYGARQVFTSAACVVAVGWAVCASAHFILFRRSL